MPVKILIPSVSPPRTKTAKERWAGIRDARSPEAIKNWIKTNMTGDQLIPKWGGHKQEIWFLDGVISSRVIGEQDSLRKYLNDFYSLFLKEDGNPWIESERNEKINLLFSMNRADRYSELARDYFNHIVKSAESMVLVSKTKIFSDSFSKLKLAKPLSLSEFYAIAIYTSEQFNQILALARGSFRGGEFAIGKPLDLWFLSFATSGMRKLAKIDTGWYEKIKSLTGPVNPPDSGKSGFLRRDISLPDYMIEDLYHISKFDILKGGFLYQKEGEEAFFSDKGMMSTTYETAGAAPYNIESNITVLIELDKTAVGDYPAVSLEKISRLPLEKEILWTPGTQFRITKIRDNRKTTFFIKDKDWRSGSRTWSKDEKLWVYLKAPKIGERFESKEFSIPEVYACLNRINFMDLIMNSQNIQVTGNTTVKEFEDLNSFYLPFCMEIRKPLLIVRQNFKVRLMEIHRLHSLVQKDAVNAKAHLNEINKILIAVYLEEISSKIEFNPFELSATQKLAFSIYSTMGFGWLTQSTKADLNYMRLMDWILDNVNQGFKSIFNNADINKRPKGPFKLPIQIYRTELIFSDENSKELRSLRTHSGIFKDPKPIVSKIGLTTESLPDTSSKSKNKVIWNISCPEEFEGAFLRIYGGILWKPDVKFEMTSIMLAEADKPFQVFLTVKPEATKTLASKAENLWN